MRVLSIHCHPKPLSFAGAVRDALHAGLEEAGHEVEVADLYREGFSSDMTAVDYAQFDNCPMPNDVLREQARVERADALAFTFPLFWWSFPSKLKGWLDRVFSWGWAYDLGHDAQGSLLSSRKGLVLITAGASERVFKKYGYDKSLHTQFYTGTWSYCGLTDVETRIFFSVNDEEMGKELAARYLAEAREMGRGFG